ETEQCQRARQAIVGRPPQMKEVFRQGEGAHGPPQAAFRLAGPQTRRHTAGKRLVNVGESAQGQLPRRQKKAPPRPPCQQPRNRRDDRRRALVRGRRGRPRRRGQISFLRTTADEIIVVLGDTLFLDVVLGG